MVDMNPIVSVINLYVNDLTKTTKRECWNGRGKKTAQIHHL